MKQILTLFALVASVVLAPGCLDAPENYYGIDLVNLKFELESTEMGIHPSRAVMDAINNPFRDADPGETKWDLEAYGGSAAAFYGWATRLVNEPIGENQYYAAVALRRIYENREVASAVLPYVRDMAIAAYEAVLTWFPSSISFDPSGQFSYRLAPLAYYGIIDLGAIPPPGWVEIATADGGTDVTYIPDFGSALPFVEPQEDEEE